MLLVHVAADLAKQRLDRGVKLNYPEALAIILDYILEGAREGAQTLPKLQSACTKVVKECQVMPGVREMMSDVAIEATFPDGTKMVAVSEPIKPETQEEHDAHKSRDERVVQARIPGEVVFGENDIPINRDVKREIKRVRLSNTGDRPVQVGSHFHLFEANPGVNPEWPGMDPSQRGTTAGYSNGLVFVKPDGNGDDATSDGYPVAEGRGKGERAEALGYRPNIPAGTAIRVEPGEYLDVELVPLRGSRTVPGLRPEGTLTDGTWATTGDEA